MPDIVNIEWSEISRAKESASDFHLAVIAGLEEGYTTQIKLFATPLKTLDWIHGSTVKLAGIKSKRGIQITLDA